MGESRLGFVAELEYLSNLSMTTDHGGERENVQMVLEEQSEEG